MRGLASAPGKLHLAGEYAVLDGAEAVVCAVDRRAVARMVGPGEESAFIDALVDRLLARRDGRAAERARAITVDTSALRQGAVKLGLGSSAAATVAACACAMAGDTVVDPDVVHVVAREAHAMAQGRRGARGSGADVAAAIHGGVIAVTPPVRTDDLPLIRRLELPPLVLVPFWTGEPADTVALVGAVAALASRPAVDAAITDIAHAAEELVIAALPGVDRDQRRATAAAIAAIAAGGEAIAALAAATGLALEPSVVDVARRIAEAVGGAVKTTGAGGGDVAILVAPPDADEARLRYDLVAIGALPLDLRIDSRGVDIQAPEV
jgi:phosphomevalonate kinase